MSAPVEAPNRDVHHDIRKLALADSLWRMSPRGAVPHSWRIPKDVYIGVASGNSRKIGAVREIVQQMGGYDVDARESTEESIKNYLELSDVGWHHAKKNLAPFVDEEKHARNTIQMVSVYKPFSAFQRDQMVTHGLGLDTDIIISGQRDRHPMGIPQDEAEFRDMLSRLSGKTICVLTSACLVSFNTKGDVVTGDIMEIYATFRKFSPQEVVAAIGLHGIRRLTGGFDLSDFQMTQFLDHRYPVRIARPNEDREILLTTDEAPPVLHDYVTGAPREMLKWVIYNGVTNGL